MATQPPALNPPPVPPLTKAGFDEQGLQRWLDTLRLRAISSLSALAIQSSGGFGGTITPTTNGQATLSLSITVSGILKGFGGALTPAVDGVDYLSHVTLSGDATGSTNSFDVLPVTLAASGVASGTYGSGALVPVVTFDVKGRATMATTALVAAPVGVTGGRPIGASDGTLYFDTSLGTFGKPIWARSMAGTGWVDATGSSA